MKKIVLARVDDRLIHTEILTLWVPEVRANRILIVDDVVAKDKFRSKVIKEMAPKGLIIHVYGIDRAVEKLKEPPSFDGERVIVIAETPLVFEELLKRGIRIPQLNIGGMGIRGERKTVARRIACDEREMESIHQIIRRGVHVYFQTVPRKGWEEAKKYLPE
ncbi:EIIAB-Man [uncultured Eubacterium sp.]|nr:EIIAB-Man [uncultured Eubacterium sp.]